MVTPTPKNSRRIFKLSQATYTYGAALLLWIFLWQYTVIQGDDRFFLTASGKPWGNQDLLKVPEYVYKTWAQYNGRLADGLGVLWYIFGDTFGRFIFAGSYVALSFLLEKWIQIFIHLDKQKLLVTRVLLLSFPFIIIASNTTVAGSSILLAAAAWNYIIPLIFILLSLLPFMAKFSNTNVSSKVFYCSLALLFVSLQMHEMLTIAVLGSIFGISVYKRSIIRESWYLQTIITLFVGVIVKLLAPGLRNRASTTYLGPTESLSKIEIFIIKLGNAFSDFPTNYPLLGGLLILLVFWNTHIHYHRLLKTYKIWFLVANISTIISLLIWTLISWKYRITVATYLNDLPSLPTHVSSKLLLLLIVAVSLTTLYFFISILSFSMDMGNPLAIFFFSGTMTAFFATALSGRSLYGSLHRANYVTLIFLAITCVIMLVEMLSSTSKNHLFTQIITALTLTLAGIALLTVSTQLYQNYIAWKAVENEIAAAKENHTTIHIPNSLPCEKLTWYWWPEDVERTMTQFRTYYAIPKPIQMVEIPQSRKCVVVP